MFKYLRLFRALFKASLTADLEFRANFILRILTDFLWYAANISTFEVLFRQTSNIRGWTVDEVRVFLGLLFVVDGIYMIFFHDNLDHLAEKVRKGELDLLLAKPVSSQFMLSCQRMAPAYVVNVGISIAYLTWAYWQLPSNINCWNLFWLIPLVPAGVLVIYSGRFFFSATAAIFAQAENIQFLWFQFYRLGMRPDSIYFKWLRILLNTLFPMAVIATIPARAILRVESPLLFLWAVTVSLIFFFLSTRYWNFALRKYASASS